MDRLTAIATFVRVAEAGSFSAVAREQRASQSAISKQVAALERHLGARLINRTTRSFSLTEEGRRFLEHAKRVASAAEEAEAAVSAGNVVRGAMRVAAPVAFGRLKIVPRLVEFLAGHPRLNVDLRLDDRFVNLVEDGIDVAVRVGHHVDAHLIARTIAHTYRVPVASREYLSVHNEPRTPEELTQHNCLLYTGLATQDRWPYHAGDRPRSIRVRGNFASNTSEGIYAAVMAGLGIAFVPVWLFGEEIRAGKVRILLAPHFADPVPIQAVYPESRRAARKVRAFVEYFGAVFAHDPFIAPRAVGAFER